MTRLSKALICSAAGIGCLAVLVSVAMFEIGARTRMANPKRSSTAVEQEIRAELPKGSSLSTVENFLARCGLDFSFDPSTNAVYALAKNLEGSTALVSKSLQVQLYFDDASTLSSISTKVLYTGP